MDIDEEEYDGWVACYEACYDMCSNLAEGLSDIKSQAERTDIPATDACYEIVCVAEAKLKALEQFRAYEPPDEEPEAPAHLGVILTGDARQEAR